MFQPHPHIVEFPADPSQDDALEYLSCNSNFSEDSQEYAESQVSSTSTEKKFHHYHEPTVMDKPEAIIAMSSAISDNHVDKLAFLAYTFGVPSFLRAAAWPLLLKHHPVVLKAKTESVPQHLPDEKIPISKIRGDLSRMSRNKLDATDAALIVDTVTAFIRLWGHLQPYETPMVWIATFLLCGPASCKSTSPTPLSTPSITPGVTPAIRSPMITPPKSPTSSMVSGTTYGSLPSSAPNLVNSDTEEFYFHGVEPQEFPELFFNFMFLITESPPQFNEFITELKSFLPGLDAHFTEEGILSGSGGDTWLVWWLKWFGIRAFPSAVLCRFWDQYFSYRSFSPVNLQKLHIMNSLVMIKEKSQKMLELDRSECRQYLMHLPPSKDVEAIINETQSLLSHSELTF